MILDEPDGLYEVTDEDLELLGQFNEALRSDPVSFCVAMLKAYHAWNHFRACRGLPPLEESND